MGRTAATVTGAACRGAILSRYGNDGRAYTGLFIALAAVQFAALVIGGRVRAGTSLNTPCPVGNEVRM